MECLRAHQVKTISEGLLLLNPSQDLFKKWVLLMQNREAVGLGKGLQYCISKLKGGLTSHFGLTGLQAIERLQQGGLPRDNPRLLAFIGEDSLRHTLPLAFDAYNERLCSLKYAICLKHCPPLLRG